MIIHLMPPRPDVVDVMLFVAAAAEIAVIVVIIARGILALFAPGDRR